jgi:cytochrome c peroxidase
MRKCFVIASLLLSVAVFISFTKADAEAESIHLRKIYSRPSAEWPAPFIDAGVKHEELGILPGGPLHTIPDSLKDIIELGKVLFFDTRLSGSGKIACASCHQPELSWTDGKEKSFGHEGTVNKRNAPTIQNVWFFKKLFWDGRSHSLEDQAFAPINSESEMHNDMRELPRHLKKITGYPILFNAAFGDPAINPDRIGEALAMFQRTIISGKSRFDDFLSGKNNALTNSELRGLHLFRTKARCINCHNGPLFSDNLFHSNGFAAMDPGLYNVTHKEADRGKMKTPSLRDIIYTGPWMHDGRLNRLDIIIDRYDQGNKDGQAGDSLIRQLGLNHKESRDLLAFLEAISAKPLPFIKPTLPGNE